MRLKDLLQGQTPQAQCALDMFFANISEERILWYPSAGKDYRDVMEMTPERLAMHQIPEQPTIICHTDYMHNWTGLDRQSRYLCMRNDAHTTVMVVEKHPLALTPGNEVDYYVRQENISRLPETFEPLIYLLKLRIQSDTLGEFDAHVFYFVFENYYFLEKMILKKRLAITHFVKVRQGCGFGGCRKCISVFYSLLGYVGVRYLLVDAEVHYDLAIHHRIANKHRIEHKNYRLQRIGMPVLRWSGFRIRAFKVEQMPGLLDNKSLNDNLAAINRNWGGEEDWTWKTKEFFPINGEFGAFRHLRQSISNEIDHKCP